MLEGGQTAHTHLKMLGQVSKYRRWIIGLAVAISLPLGVFAIRWFVFGSSTAVGSSTERSIEASWFDTIEKLGIEPRFPPEEDFVVGDLLALVTKDEDDDPTTKNKISDPRTVPFPRRAVKLAHIDVNKALNEEYGQLPFFPNLVDPALSASRKSGKGAAAVKPAARLIRDFSAGVQLNDLPLAAFPRLKIQGTSSASAGASASGFWGSFGASNKEVEELELGEVRTYGLPSIRAIELLDTYCRNLKTKNNCTEETARNNLRSLTDNRSVKKYVIDSEGNEQYAMKVEIVMVYRIYLTRSIKNLRQDLRAQQGGARVTAVASQAEATSVSPAQLTGTADPDAMKRRIEELERKLAEVQAKNALVAEIGSERLSSFNGTFDRPVAIGFRGIRVDFASLKAKP